MIRYFWPSDDEQLAGQWQDSHFDEDASWWASAQQCGAVVALAAVLTLTAASTALASSVFAQAQDDPSLITVPTPPEELYWQNPVAPVVWPQPSAITYDDTHVAFAEAFQVDEDFWTSGVAPVAPSNYVQLPFLEPFDSPQFTAAVPVTDDSSVWGPLLPPREYDWTLLFFLDDGSTVPIFQYDEDFWAPQIPAQNWPQPAQAIRDTDENVPNFVSAEDPVWQQLVQPVADGLKWPWPFVWEQNETPILTAFTTEEYWLPLTAPVPDSIWLLRQDNFEQTDATGSLVSQYDEEAWLNPTVPVAASLYQPLPYGFDEAQPSFFVPFSYEEYWLNPVAPVPASLALLQQWPFEQNEPGNLSAPIFEETLWQNPVWPVADSLRLQQQWAFEQNEPGNLRTNFDEDFWQNGVAPVASYPVPGIYFQIEGGAWDEITVPLPTASLDELYWAGQVSPIVFPVPDRMFLLFPYEPEPEEIPAGSLVPFVPPPPPFCPLPPTGPDGDIHMSNFNTARGGPVLALFCRICNSQKPLVVRADYAIWCQDCCAFVSKQDTYMGTVRAPGQFKAIF